MEQKKRVVAKRGKLEKDKADQKKPQEITEEDITRSENETTKNVAAVRVISPIDLNLSLTSRSSRKFLKD